METQFNGNFGLFEINKIIRKNNYYEITFQNTKKRIVVTHLNCFIDDNGIPKNLTDLKYDDKIWIDISAYTADKSLYNYNHFGCVGRYVRAIKYNKN